MRAEISDGNTILSRIEQSRRALSAMRDEAAREMRRRDGLIREAIDEGHPFRVVGRAAGMEPGGVAKVLSKPAPQPAAGD